MPEIDATNHQMVSVRGNSITVLMPKREMTADEAMVHAAWLATLAEMDASITLEEALKAVQAT